MRSTIKVALVATILVMGISSIAVAKPAEVWMGPFMVMRIRTDAQGMSATQRASTIQARANNLTKCGGIVLSSIKAVKSGSDYQIWANKKLFATVTSADAQANGSTVKELAYIWRDSLRAIYPKVNPKGPADCVAPKYKKPLKLPKAHK